MEWTVDYTLAGLPAEEDLIGLQAEFDAHGDDVAVSALPDTGQWRLSFGVHTTSPVDALHDTWMLLGKFDITSPVAAVEVLTIEELERRADAPTMPTLVGSSEIADMLDVSRQRVHQLRANAYFPLPLVEVAMGPLWDERAVKKFAQEWERKPGRPSMV